jgi:hypothetical protein
MRPAVDKKSDRADSQSWPVGDPVRRFVAKLVAVLLLAHAVLGCCWHHEHACDHAACAAVAATDHDHDCFHNDSDHQPAEHSHSDCELHCAGVCQFLPVERRILSKPLSSYALAAETSRSLAVGSAELLARSVGQGRATAALPVRLHLAYGLLLI